MPLHVTYDKVCYYLFWSKIDLVAVVTEPDVPVGSIHGTAFLEVLSTTLPINLFFQVWMNSGS